MSDLFTERNQFDMMFSTLMELQKLHPPEDEILNQYLVPAICKAAAVLGMVRSVDDPLCVCVCELPCLTMIVVNVPESQALVGGWAAVLESACSRFKTDYVSVLLFKTLNLVIVNMNNFGRTKR